MTRQRRNFGSSSALFENEETVKSKPVGEIIWQKSKKSSISARNFKKTTERIPTIPNKSWTSNMIKKARNVLEQAKAEPPNPDVTLSRSESPKPSFAISKTTSVNGLDLDATQLYMSDLQGKRLQAWAKQTMQDVISPQAFQKWTQDHTIPNTPDAIWTQKDIRLAHMFKKRQWKLKKILDTVREKQENTVTTSKRLNISYTSASPLIPSTRKDKKKEKAKEKHKAKQQEHPTITSLKLQAQSRVRARILKEAFRGLLSPSQQRSASSAIPSSAQENPEFRITNPILTQRIMHLITMHEPGSPRIRVYELLDIHRFPYNEEMDVAIAKEKREQRKEELRTEFTSWRNAAEEVRKGLEGKYPGNEERGRWKRVVEQEFEEIKKVEDAVAGFLTG